MDEVIVRPVRPDDAPALRSFFRCLSPRTLGLRFHYANSTVDDTLMRSYADADQQRHLALVCEAHGKIIGDARCIAHPGRESCELGIVVADEWHHTGIAQKLMQALEEQARRRGYRRIEGLVLAENAGMLDFMHELGFESQLCTGEPATVRVVKRL